MSALEPWLFFLRAFSEQKVSAVPSATNLGACASQKTFQRSFSPRAELARAPTGGETAQTPVT